MATGGGTDDRLQRFGPVARSLGRSALDIDVAHEIVREAMAATCEQSILEVFVRYGYDGVHPTTAGLALEQDDGTLALVGGIAVPSFVAASFPLPLDTGVPMAEAVVSRVPLWVESAADRDRWYPYLNDFDGLPHAGGFLPVDLAGGQWGVLAIMFDRDRAISEPERRYWTLLADVCALAIDRLYRGRTLS